MNDVSVISAHRKVMDMALNMGLEVVAVGGGQGFIVRKEGKATELFNSQSIFVIQAYLQGYKAREPEKVDDFVYAIEKLKEAGATLIRALNGPVPRPNLDESIDAMEELL